MYSLPESVIFGLIAGLLVAAILAAAWPWTRQRGRFALAGVLTAATFVGWRLVLGGATATGFDVDAPVIRVSWEDVGSGVLAFAATALALGLGADRKEPAQRVVGAAAVAGLIVLIYDLVAP
jgi:hypothetical protein